MNYNIRIFYANIRSINCHYNELLLTLNSLQDRLKKTYDIIALSESWITEDQLQLYPITGYRAIIQPRLDGRKSGGVLIYIKESYQLTSTEKVEISGGDALKIGLQLERNNSQSNNSLTIYLIYRDCTASRLRFVQELDRILNESESEAVLIGDININLLDPVSSVEYQNMLMTKGFISVQNEPTREEACLDHVFARNSDTIVETRILSERITDHSLIEVLIKNIGNHDYKLKTIEKEKIKILNYKKLEECLKNRNWNWVNTLKKNVSVDYYFNKFFEEFWNCIKKATRTTKGNQGRDNKLRQPWMTSELLDLVKRKSEAYFLYKNNREDNNKKENYKLISAKVKKETRKYKIKYYSELLDSVKDNPKEYWQIINGVRGKKHKQGISEIRVKGKILKVEENAIEIADEFNKYYNEVTEKLLKDNGFGGDFDATDKNKWNDKSESTSQINGEILENFNLTIEDVEKAIMSLKNKNSVGKDCISSRMVKALPKLFSKILTPL